MNKTFVATSILLLSNFFSFGQLQSENSVYKSVSTTKTVDKVIKLDYTKYEILDYNKMIIHSKTVTTYYHPSYQKNLPIFTYYSDKEDQVKNLSIQVFDANGKLIQKAKKNEINDIAAYDGFSLAQDSRYKFYALSVNQLPFTVEHSYELHTPNTIYLRNWPYLEPGVKVEKSVMDIDNLKDLDLAFKEKSMEGYEQYFELDYENLSFTMLNFEAPSEEIYTKPIIGLMPKIFVSLRQFNYGKSSGNFSDWRTYGLWKYNNYLKDKNNLNQESIDEVAALLVGKEDKYSKAKAIYDYVVNSTRYVSIQLGEGGYEPFYAQDVHDQKYGDCKALTMYTKSLMDEFGIENFYTEVFAGSQSKINYQVDFASFGQGNHVLLTIPFESDTVWAECTSSKVPFGYRSSFTADRWALAHHPEGGEPIYIKGYDYNENKSDTKIDVFLDLESSQTNMKVVAELFGRLIDERFRMTGIEPIEISENYYPHFYPSFESYGFDNLKTEPIGSTSFKESFDVQSNTLISKAGNYYIIQPLLIKSDLKSLEEDDRKYPIHFSEGYSKVYNYTYTAPEGFEFGSFPNSISFDSEFGSFTLTGTSTKEELQLTCRYVLYNMTHALERLPAYNEWLSEIKKVENEKLLIKSN